MNETITYMMVAFGFSLLVVLACAILTNILIKIEEPWS